MRLIMLIAWDNKSLEEIARIITSDQEIEILEDSLETEYNCDCNEDRIKRGIILLNKEDFEEIFKYEDKINVKCEFCNKEYNFYKSDFEKRLI